MTNKSVEKSDDAVLPSIDEAFHLTDLYPDASALFSHNHASLDDIKDDCIVVLDGNVLLFPYEYNSASIGELEKVYSKLAVEGRLIVPGHAAREFYKHRSSKVAKITEDIEGKVKKLKEKAIDTAIPLLEDNATYKEAIELGNEINAKRTELVKILEIVSGNLRDEIAADRVSNLYRKILADTVKDIPCEKAEERKALLAEAQRRTAHKIPPGFKDGAKPDGGIGDYLIWLTALQEGKSSKKHCIFVTNEEKNDWWIRSSGTFQPRPELIDEYRRETKGKSVHLMPLSDLLELFEASPVAVENAKEVEEVSRNKVDYILTNHRKHLLDKTDRILTQKTILDYLDNPDASLERDKIIQQELTNAEERLKLYNAEIEMLERILRSEDVRENSAEDADSYFRKLDALLHDKMLLNKRIKFLSDQLPF